MDRVKNHVTGPSALLAPNGRGLSGTLRYGLRRSVLGLAVLSRGKSLAHRLLKSGVEIG